MFVVTVYRPELVVADEPYPFEGYELVGVFGQQTIVDETINALMEGHPDWHFHIDNLRVRDVGRAMLEYRAPVTPAA